MRSPVARPTATLRIEDKRFHFFRKGTFISASRKWATYNHTEKCMRHDYPLAKWLRLLICTMCMVIRMNE
jgi:hypothetical protein